MSQVVQIAGSRRTPKNRGPAFRGIAPGGGATAPVAFGSTKGRQRPQQKKKKFPGKGHVMPSHQCWNAFAPQHLALPRAVGEYTVTRGTRQIFTNDKLIIIGTWSYLEGNETLQSSLPGFGGNWSDVCALGCGDLTNKPNQTAWSAYKMPMLASGLGNHSQITPAACSVQIMNGNALSQTNGMLYIGKMKVQPQYAGDDVTTAGTIGGNFVSYMAPRLCSAAKLALRGVQVDAHPLNMNRLADFTQIYRGFPGSAETPGQTVWSSGLSPSGFTPIVIYNPDAVSLNLLVCHEYRTRFDLMNPAVGSHKYHQPSTDRDWAGMIKTATDLGSGAMDIADVVAKSGLASRAFQAFSGVGRTLG
jgi:hypothetical protein